MSRVRLFHTSVGVFTAAREHVLGVARASITERGRFDFVLSGGRTPESVYKSLVDADLEWRKVHVWFGDERCVPPVHVDSNYHMANEALLSRVAIPPANVHRIRGEMDAYRAAEEYEAEMRKVLKVSDGELPRFDLVLLGMGPDGHTASLFPGTPALEEEDALCCGTWVEKFKAYRVTMTFPVFDNAANVLFLACGADKAPMVKLATADTIGPDTPPAGCVRPTHGELLWFVDAAAGAS
jgi:6-phosphogluconolactonase